MEMIQSHLNEIQHVQLIESVLLLETSQKEFFSLIIIA